MDMSRLPKRPSLLSLALAAVALATSCAPGANGSGWAQAGAGPALPADPVAAVAADSARLLADLQALSSDEMEGRRSSTAGGLRARELVVRGFRDAGVEPSVVPFAFESRREGTPTEGANVLGSVTGTSLSDEWIVVTAHYDHVGIRNGEIYNGADDNASGTAALLFLGRWLTEHPLEHSVLLAAVDAEELGLRGARALVAEPPVPLESVRLNVNMDMVARTGGVLWAAGAYHHPELRPILEEVARGSPEELRLGHDEPGVEGMDDWSRSSDHRAFHDAGIPFVYFGVEDHPDYHRPTDDFERVDPREFLDAVATVALALRALDRGL